MPITVTRLRQNIYRVVDEVLETGVPLEIERNGKLLRLVPAEQRSLFDNFERRDDLFLTDPEELVSIDWSDTWQP